jgi:hypothetical protein
MKYQITFVEFWNRFGKPFGLSLVELTDRSSYYLKNRPDIEEELGLEIIGGYGTLFHFKVIDKHKFFLAKIKYGI